MFGLKGCRIDRVSQLANAYLDGLSESTVTKDAMLQRTALHAKEADAIMTALNSYPRADDLQEVQWRTLICNKTLDLA